MGGLYLYLLAIKENNSLEEPLLTVENMAQIKSTYNLTDRAANGIASALRVATKNRKVIKSGLKPKLSAIAYSVDDYFSCKMFNFVYIKANQLTDNLKVEV